MKISIVGAGRAGSSFATALRSVGHDVAVFHHEDVASLDGAALVILCVPDDAIAGVAATIVPRDDRVLAHVAGSRTLDVLLPPPRGASLHPLMALPSGSEAERLIGATYCVAGDQLVREVVLSLAG